jgi:hypothetical protein
VILNKMLSAEVGTEPVFPSHTEENRLPSAFVAVATILTVGFLDSLQRLKKNSPVAVLASGAPLPTQLAKGEGLLES